MASGIKTDNLVIVCSHILNGKSVYHQSKDSILCKKCFTYYNSFGRDDKGHWKVPKTEKFESLHTVCRDCVSQLKNNI